MITEHSSHPYSLFKKGSLEKVIQTPDGVHGVCHVADLNTEFINALYGSMYFTKEYDQLPLLIRMWLTSWRWNELVQLAKTFDCDNDESKILYSDVLEFDGENILTGPVIITNGHIAICSAPRIMGLDNFETIKEVELLDVTTSDIIGEQKENK
jgi:hypothetical protein